MTVADLIRILQQAPADAKVNVYDHEYYSISAVQSVYIDPRYGIVLDELDEIYIREVDQRPHIERFLK